MRLKQSAAGGFVGAVTGLLATVATAVIWPVKPDYSATVRIWPGPTLSQIGGQAASDGDKGRNARVRQEVRSREVGLLVVETLLLEERWRLPREGALACLHGATAVELVNPAYDFIAIEITAWSREAAEASELAVATGEAFLGLKLAPRFRALQDEHEDLGIEIGRQERQLEGWKNTMEELFADEIGLDRQVPFGRRTPDPDYARVREAYRRARGSLVRLRLHHTREGLNLVSPQRPDRYFQDVKTGERPGKRNAGAWLLAGASGGTLTGLLLAGLGTRLAGRG